MEEIGVLGDVCKKLDELFHDINPQTLAIACSGGIDSMALAIVSKIWTETGDDKFNIIALIVDHKLRNESSFQAKATSEILSSHNIKSEILTWEHDKINSNIESLAREARYNLMLNYCKKNGIKYLLLGHNIQDVAENFLIRLFRGSNLDGLSSMSFSVDFNGIHIIRPILECSKNDLREFLMQRNITWVEDESNHDEKFLRNKIRNFLNSFENQDDIIGRISNTSSEVKKWRDNIEQNLMEKISGKIQVFDFGMVVIKPELLDDLSDLEKFELLPDILNSVSGNIYKPRFQKLKHFMVFGINFGEAYRKTTFHGCVIEYIKGEIIFYREFSKISDNIINGIWDGRFFIESITEEEYLNYLTNSSPVLTYKIPTKIYNRIAKTLPRNLSFTEHSSKTKIREISKFSRNFIIKNWKKYGIIAKI